MNNRKSRNIRKWQPIAINGLNSEKNCESISHKVTVNQYNLKNENTISTSFDTLKELFPQISDSSIKFLMTLDSQSLNDIIISLYDLNPNEIDNNIKELSGIENKSNFEENIMSDQILDELADTETDSESEDSGVSSFPSVEEEAVMISLENTADAEQCLVLGRVFLEQAHSLFSTDCGTGDIDIGQMPLAITEMGWRPPPLLMRSIYRGFLEHIGVLGPDEGKLVTVRHLKTESTPSASELTSLREVMQIEEAVDRSLDCDRARIAQDENLKLQLAGLAINYPGFSDAELELTFIQCGLDITSTNAALKKKGFIKVPIYKKKLEPKEVLQSVRKQKPPDCTEEPEEDHAERMARLQVRLDQLRGQLQHCRGQLVQQSAGSGTRHYWRERLVGLAAQVTWYRHQLGLAVVAQRRLVHGLLELDLHHLGARTALASLDTRLAELATSDRRSLLHGHHLRIICGRGLHSPGGRSRLKPIVRRHLLDLGLPFQQKLDGVYFVPLKKIQVK